MGDFISDPHQQVIDKIIIKREKCYKCSDNAYALLNQLYLCKIHFKENKEIVLAEWRLIKRA